MRCNRWMNERPVGCVAKLVASHGRGALTDNAVCLIAAGDGHASESFAGLTPELRQLVSRHVSNYVAPTRPPSSSQIAVVHPLKRTPLTASVART
jgi:hypothetical protein